MEEQKNWLETLTKDVTVTTYKATGPGGQHRNKTESAVRLLHEPTGIIVTASESRSQRRNREMAWQRLIEKLEARDRKPKPRIETKLPKRIKEARLKQKRVVAQKKADRKKPGSSDDDRAFFIA